MCKIFKFGGASVKDAQAVRNVAQIITKHKGEKILMIVSAMGKTTNALEQVAESQYYEQPKREKYLEEAIDFHLNICRELFPKGHTIQDEIEEDWKTIPRLVKEHQTRGYDFVYDQIVSLGEWAATKIVSAYMQEIGILNTWLDAIDYIQTNDQYRDSRVDWIATQQQCKSLYSLFERTNILITQGFTGKSKEGFVTTLGREGSDFSAAIFSYCLDAQSMTVWKDVPGILNADPRRFNNTIKLDKISYKEAIEMTYYGAKVIHPKTIKPLQNKAIPLYVKSFLHPDNEGTVISDTGETKYPPIVVVEPKQTFLHISTKDFSFVAEEHLSRLFTCFAQHRIKVNVMRNTAISFSVCISHQANRLEKLIEELSPTFNIEQTKNLELITIRYYNDEIIKQLKQRKIVVHEEKLNKTIQIVVRDVPLLERK